MNLCKCSGGIRFAHYECIKKWMETKLSLKENVKKTVKYLYQFKIKQPNQEDDKEEHIESTINTNENSINTTKITNNE